jgi:subtilisin family serine protease
MMLRKERRPVAVGVTGLAATALLLTALPTTAGAATAAPLVGAASANAVAGEYLVVLKPGASTQAVSSAVRRAEATGAAVGQRFTHAVDGYTATLAKDELDEVRSDPAVAYVEAVRGAIASRSASGPVRRQVVQSPTSWNLDRVDQRPYELDGRYVYGASGRGVTAYMIGTGVDADHPDIGSRVRPGVNTSGDGQDTSDCFGYSTIGADLLGGRSWGVAKNVSLVPVKTYPCLEGATSTTATEIAGIEWVIAQHDAGEPAVANIDDWFDASPALDAAVNALIADGVVTVAVSGQPLSGDPVGSACSYSPGRVKGVVTVAASTEEDGRDSRYTHVGSCLDLWAPGRDVIASYDITPGQFETVFAWGTAFAAPHVAGTAANYLETHPSATPAQVAAAIDAATTRGAITNPGTGSPNRLLYTLPADTPPRTPAADRIASSTALRRGESIKSPNGFYTLTQQTDGNVVLTRPVGRVTWALGRRGSWLRMEADGNLVAYDFGRAVWSSGTGGNGASELRVQNDGNLVVYRLSDGHATWASRSSARVPQAQPTAVSDRLTPNLALYRNGMRLQSPSGRYRASVHGPSGRLVVRDETRATYVFKTPAVDSDWLTLQADGNLVLYSRTGRVLWSTATGGRGASDLVMQDDGNLVLYQRSNGRPTWSWRSGKL